VPAKKRPTEITPAVASQPLNRKYRPQRFDAAELVGQNHVVNTLKNAIRHNRIAPAYLFCGPRGTGKTSTARILAKAANCLDPDPDNRPCNVCTACVAINSGATPDVIEIDAASNRGIDDIRDLRERVNYAPTQLKTKFYIIDEAHQITGAAANAFLKTLEEPPAHTKFILATTDPEELPATIISRCQRFDFRRHTVEGIAGRIRAVAEREGIALASDAIDLIAKLAHGSMRDPIGLLDQLANVQGESGKSELSADDVRALVGLSGSEAADRILEAIANRNAAAALTTIAEAVQNGQDPRQLNRQIVGLIRDALYKSSGAPVVSGSSALEAVVAKRPLQDLIEIASQFSSTESDIRSAVIPQLPLEIAVLRATLETPAPANVQPAPAVAPTRVEPRPRPEPAKSQRTDLAAAPPTPAGSRLQDRVRPRENAARHPTLAEPEPAEESAPSQPAPAVTNGAATIEQIREQWLQIRADVKSLDRRTEALLMEIDPFDIQDGQVILASPYDFHRNMLNDAERRGFIETVIQRRFGVRLRVSTSLRTELLEARRAATATVAETAVTVSQVLETSAEDDEKYLKAVISITDGELLDDPVE